MRIIFTELQTIILRLLQSLMKAVKALYFTMYLINNSMVKQLIEDQVLSINIWPHILSEDTDE